MNQPRPHCSLSYLQHFMVFNSFMEKLTGTAGMRGLGPSFSWRIHGVLVTWWLGANSVKVYHAFTRSRFITATHFPNAHSECCREYLCNLQYSRTR